LPHKDIYEAMLNLHSEDMPKMVRFWYLMMGWLQRSM
jgi:hypothetical protein